MCQVGTPERRKLEKYHLFVDMDGTLAKFTPIEELEGIQSLYEKGYFSSLDPLTNIVDGIKQLQANHSEEVEITILSSYLEDSKYALDEKKEWLDKYLPGVTDRLFVPCGTPKHEALKECEVKGVPVLLDDYSKNLHEWIRDGDLAGVKLLNGINGNRGTWKGQTLRLEDSADPLMLLSSMHLSVHTKDTLRQDYFTKEITRTI